MDDIPTNNIRWPLIRQAIVFQFKLGLDALRDILMSPVSILLALIDIVMANQQEKSYFLRLMELGKQSDRWINLFGHNLGENERDELDGAPETNVDYWFCKIEEVINERRGDGNFSQSAKEKLQRYINKINQSSDKPESKGSE